MENGVRSFRFRVAQPGSYRFVGRISTEKRASVAEPTSSDRPVESSRRRRLSHLYFRYVAFYCRSLLAPLQTHPCAPARAILPAIPGVAANVAPKQPEIVHHTRASPAHRQLWNTPNAAACFFLARSGSPLHHICLSPLPGPSGWVFAAMRMGMVSLKFPFPSTTTEIMR
jgi:hypothetical protein